MDLQSCHIQDFCTHKKNKMMKVHKHIYALLLVLLFVFAAKAQEGEYITHTVTKGQTLFSISKMYDTTVEIIVRNNPGSARTISVGQKLKIPRNRLNSNSDENIAVRRNGKLYHTIRSKETLFSLGKKYGVTPEEICEANPGLSISNFPVGKEIIIPQKEVAQTVNEEKKPPFQLHINGSDEKKPEIRKTHKVKRRETIEKICKKYDITREEFLKANPQLEGKEVERKMIVNIPKKKKTKQEKQKHGIQVENDENRNTKDNGSNDNLTRIAVILPFLLDRYAPEEQGRMVEFYQGFLMAVERLKREKHSFEINTYDSGFSDNSLDSLIRSGALNDMNLIIGAYYPNHNKQLGRFASERRIPLVIPFSNKQDELYNNPMVFFINTLQSTIMQDVTGNFVTTFPNANVIFVEDSIKGNKGRFIRSMTAELDRHDIPHTTISMDEIVLEGEREEEDFIDSFRALAADSLRRNIIIPTSSSKETLNRILPSLVMANAMDTALMNRFNLFGYPEWQVYAQQTREQMYEVDTYFYATFYAHFSLPEAAKFQNDFIRWYNRDLQKIFPRYGMLGYDIGYHFLLAVSMYGKDMAERIGELDSAPIQTGFKFERMNGNGGMMNKKLYFIHYTRDYNIEKKDLDRCEEQ